jgi:hypothetical protein
MQIISQLIPGKEIKQKTKWLRARTRMSETNHKSVWLRVMGYHSL